MRLILTFTTCFAVMQSISAAGVEFADVGVAREELHHANIAPWRVPSIMNMMKGAAIAGLLAIGGLTIENDPATRRAAVRAVNTGLSMSAKALESMAAGVRDYNQDETFEDYYNNLLGKVSGNDEFNVLSEYEGLKLKSELNRDDFISERYRNDFLRLTDQLTDQLTRETEEPHERNNMKALQHEITSYMISHPEASRDNVLAHLLPVSDEIRANIRTRFSGTHIFPELLVNRRHMLLPFLHYLKRLENDAILRFDIMQRDLISSET